MPTSAAVSLALFIIATIAAFALAAVGFNILLAGVVVIVACTAAVATTVRGPVHAHD